MPVVSIESDPVERTVTVVVEVGVTRDEFWRAFTDPRRLERFWGPPEWPATFTAFDAVPGGMASYHMTGPDGEIAAGCWDFVEVDAPHRIVLLDHFANDDGSPNDAMPVTDMRLTFDAIDQGARLTMVSTLPSAGAFEQLDQMGMVEGMRSALDQIDGVLADPA